MDLAIVLALVSGIKDKALDEKTVLFGEVGLLGEVRAVSMPEYRVKEAKKLGFTRCILPAINLRKMAKEEGMELIGVSNIREALEYLQ